MDDELVKALNAFGAIAIVMATAIFFTMIDRLIVREEQNEQVQKHENNGLW